MKTNVLKISLVSLLLTVAVICPSKSETPIAVTPEIIGSENAVLTDAPDVPPPITRTHATKVIVNLEVKEVTRRLADGVDYTFWTFGGSVPGKFIRVRESDEVEIHLANAPDSKMPHNIDLHAVSGPGGGAAASFVAPGHESQFTFRALNPGLYVYHCATAPVGMHIANGMYGLILVEPTNGLPKVDKEFYVMQGEFYTAGKFGDPGLQPFDLDKAVDERPAYVVFNGAVGSLTDSNALTARVSEKIRFFVGNGGPNLVSSFHIIGNIFDNVYEEGGTIANQHNVQTTLVPAGGAAMVEFTPKVPGTYTFLDHSILRAFNKGCIGQLKVTGDANCAIFSGKQSDTIFTEPETNSVPAVKIEPVAAKPAENSQSIPANMIPAVATQMESGRQVYQQICFVCHQPNGLGVPNQIPPLAGSDFLAHEKVELIRTLIQGRSGEIVVNGKKFSGIMVPQANLTDDQIANVLTFVRNNWNNSGDAVTPDEVRAARAGAKPVAAANSFE
ncbi:MAG TPA: copper-containing nitrite reductase [Verrucomicrobiae bacterium]|nr:copper-containing nitrite reductase [Verrucomicrobiae bacterium]